jgi:hypothetical protein
MLRRIFKAIFGLQEPAKEKGYTRAQLAKELEPGLNALFGAEYAKYENKNRNHPRYCDSLRALLESGKPYTISELQVKLGKRKGTVYHEMSELRSGGFVIRKQYDKSISANKYRIAE